MANSSILSKSTKQKNKNWLNDSDVGSYNGFAKGLEGTPRKYYTSSVINGEDEPSPKRARTGGLEKELELNFSDDEDEIIDPHGYMRNWVQRQRPSDGIKSITFCDDSSFHSSFFSFLSSDSGDDSNMGRNDSSIERSISRFFHEELEEKVQMKHQGGSLVRGGAVVDHNKSQNASSELSLHVDHDTPRNESSMVRSISRVLQGGNSTDNTLVSNQNKDGLRNDQEQDGAIVEDIMEHMKSCDLVVLKNNLGTSQSGQVAVAELQQMVDKKDDNEGCLSQTSFRSRIMTPKIDVNCPKKLNQSSKSISASPSVGRNKRRVGGPTGKFWQCKICSRPFNNKTSASSHSHTHRNWEELQKTQIFHSRCEVCDKIFFNRQHFNDHMNMHQGNKNHSCPICKKKFTQKRGMTSHLFVHLDRKEKSRVKEGWKHECYFCQNKFKAPFHLHTHLVVHTGEKPFHCHKCRRQFNKKSNLTTHMRSHNPATRRAFRCEECGKCFTQKANLTRHEKMVHLRLKDIQCPRCNKMFATKDNMVQHLNGVHRGIRHPCSHCDKTFSHKGHVRRHEKHAHPK